MTRAAHAGISVLILTKDEQRDLPGCLESVAWCDDVHVLDSCSSDATVHIARNAGAQVHVRAFDGYASQRNHGLRRIPYRHPWLLLLDADERVGPDLVAEMRLTVATATCAVAAARLRRRDIWNGQWLKHAQISPYFVRLVRPDRVHYEREINEVLVVDGRVVDLRGSFDHYPFSKGLDHWIARHNRYSHAEALQQVNPDSFDVSWRIALFGTDFNERRRHQKAIFYRLPVRPLLKFAYMLFVRRAFLDGRVGIRYAILQAMYEHWIVLKAQEIAAQSGPCRTTKVDASHLEPAKAAMPGSPPEAGEAAAARAGVDS